jgi:(p)ppGpp synthase/HD superfamily hydrolase
MSQENRVETMAIKLGAYARRAGVVEHQLLEAYEIAVEKRLTQLRDAFHPDVLRPARTALILLEDAAVSDVEMLIAGALIETEFPEMRVAETEIRTRFGERVADLSLQVPQPSELGEMLMEHLISVPDDVALIAVAERLDQARHLHFRAPSLWQPFVTQIETVYLPFAYRISEPLAIRFSRWLSAFRRRLPQST